jgi:hypothetical protein
VKGVELSGWLATATASLVLLIQEVRNEMDAQRVAELELDRRARVEKQVEAGHAREAACFTAWARDQH